MKTIRVAIIGTGFMGRVHLEALRRVEFVEVTAIAGRDREGAERLGRGFSIEKIAEDYRDLLRDPEIEAVHICTPNAQHYPMAKAALRAGKHVVCEKPLATGPGQGEELVALAELQGLFHCVCHNLRYYPMVQQMRRMREGGDLGEILILQGTYFQDWLLYETDWNWRVDAAAGGASRCMADIGSHWFDMAEHLSGLRVTSLCADLQTFHATRSQPNRTLETFGNNRLEYDDRSSISVDTEDFGAVIFRMGQKARGTVSASQVSAGRKNRLSLEMCGSRAAVAWSQERPDELWVGHRDEGNQICIKDPSLLKPEARAYANLPGGHSEGYDDTFKQLFRRFYSALSGESHSQSGQIPEYPSFADGLRQLRILDAVMESNRTRGWVDVQSSQPASERKKN
jgi:predicted dehydrogenase